MSVSHIALALKDIEKTHRFPAEAMGFDLVKVEIVPRF
jgi:catechol 2,3-dioxygenase-like lactoylglutathione lyase family enzyme